MITRYTGVYYYAPALDGLKCGASCVDTLAKLIPELNYLFGRINILVTGATMKGRGCQVTSGKQVRHQTVLINQIYAARASQERTGLIRSTPGAAQPKFILVRDFRFV